MLYLIINPLLFFFSCYLSFMFCRIICWVKLNKINKKFLKSPPYGADIYNNFTLPWTYFRTINCSGAGCRRFFLQNLPQFSASQRTTSLRSWSGQMEHIGTTIFSSDSELIAKKNHGILPNRARHLHYPHTACATVGNLECHLTLHPFLLLSGWGSC